MYTYFRFEIGNLRIISLSLWVEKRSVQQFFVHPDLPVLSCGYSTSQLLTEISALFSVGKIKVEFVYANPICLNLFLLAFVLYLFSLY